MNTMHSALKSQRVPETLTEGQKIINGVLVETEQKETQTPDDNKIADKYERAKIELGSMTTKNKELEKKFKEARRDADIFEENVKKMQKKIDELQFLEEKRKVEDKKRQEEMKNLTIMGPQEKEKFKKLAEENIRLKLKIKEMLEIINELEKENKQNMTKFKNFIMGNPGLSEEQKRLLLGKAEELFQNNMAEKLNLKELEFVSRIDEQMMKDKFVKDCIGDHVSIVKKINREERDKKLKKAKPGYNADFDVELMVI